MAQHSWSFLLVACLVAAILQPLLIASRAFFCVSRRTNRSATAKHGLPVLGVTGRMAVPSGEGATAVTEAQRAEVLRLPPKTVTSKDAEIAVPQGPQPKQGSWSFQPRQSSNAESADDDNDDESELVAARRAALRLPGPKEEAELRAKQRRQEEIEAMYETNGSTEEFTVPEQIVFFACSASVMWLWIMNAYKTFERFGSGPHL
jgi:hypothetical protein